VRGELARPKLPGCHSEQERRRREDVPIGANLDGPIAEPIGEQARCRLDREPPVVGFRLALDRAIPGNGASTTPRGFRMRWMVSTAARTS
jgi:hypothetical protein